MADQNQAQQDLQRLQTMVSRARAAYLRHTGDPDGGNAYLQKFEDVANALDALNLGVLTTALAGLKGDTDQIDDATKRLSAALTAITGAEGEFQTFTEIVDDATNLLNALQGGDPQTIGDALDKIRTDFVAPVNGGG